MRQTKLHGHTGSFEVMDMYYALTGIKVVNNKYQ